LKYVYDEASGKAVEHPPHSGRLVPRPAGALPPCRIAGLGCPKGTPENPLSLSDVNSEAYRHYRECRATGNFPDDPIVRRNAALIRAQEDEAALRDRSRWFDQLRTILRRLQARRMI
jgi:hypothetical protein